MSFFTRPPDPLDGTAHRRRAHSYSMALLEDAALVLQAQVIVRLQLRHQFSLQRSQFAFAVVLGSLWGPRLRFLAAA